MSAALIRYEAACQALAEARAVDEVIEIRSKADAMRVYAQQSQNRDLEIQASEIRFRAEYRLGRLIEEQRRDFGLARGGRPRQGEAVAEAPITLAELGIGKALAHRARTYAALDDGAFEGILARRRERLSETTDKVTLDLFRAGTKAQRRAAREAELARKVRALPGRRYGVICADPEWRFEVWSRVTGLDRSADNHYPTSLLQEIKDRDVASIAAADCVLFLWSSVPFLAHAIDVMGCWGFEYKSNFVWAKDRTGTGYWNRTRHEHFLLGTRGNVPCPAPGEQWISFLPVPVGAHSAKPGLFYDLVESYFPTLPKIELNARAPREGWDVWGDEVDGPEAKTDDARAAREDDDGDEADDDDARRAVNECLGETPHNDGAMTRVGGNPTEGPALPPGDFGSEANVYGTTEH